MGKKDDDFVEESNKELDFDSLDFDDSDDMFDAGSAPNPKKRTPIDSVKVGAINAIKFKATDIDKVGETVTDNYHHFGSVVQGTLDTAGELANEVRDLKESVAPSILRLKRSSRKVLPYAKKFIPTKMYDKIRAKLETSDHGGFQRASVEQERTEFIKDQLSNLFTAQVDLQEQQQIEETKEKLIDQQVEDKKFASSITILSKIKNLLKQQTSIFQTGIKTYIIKSLELKYKGLFVSQDMLTVQKNMLNVLDKKLTDISFNSALPDIQKQRKSESFKQEMRSLTFGKLASSAGDYSSTFFSKISKNIKKNIFKKLKDDINEYADMGSELMEGVAEMKEMEEEEGTQKSEIESTTGLGVGFLKSLGIRYAAKLSKKLGGQHAKDFDDIFRVLKESSPFVINRKLKEYSEKEGIVGKLANYLSENVVPKLDEERGIVSNIELESPTESIPWDVVSRKTLVEIIPGYLSRITQNTESLVTGKPADELVFDFGVGDFVSVKSLRESTFKKYFGTKEERSKEIQKLIAVIFSGYKNNGGDIEEINVNMSGIVRFVNNIVKHALDFSPKQILNYVNGKNYDKRYIRWAFKGISDPSIIANIIVKAFFKDEKVISHLEREFSSEAIDLTKKRDEYVKELGKLNAYGQKRHFTDLIVQEKSVEELEKYKSKLEKKILKSTKRDSLTYEEKEKIRSQVREFANKKELNHNLIRNILQDIDYETLYENITSSENIISKELKKANEERAKAPINKLKKSKDKIDKVDSEIPLRDDPHISGPGVYAQGSKFEAHIPLDSPSGFFSGFKQILDEIDYKSELIEIQNILRELKTINLSTLSGITSQLGLSLKDKKGNLSKKLFGLIKTPVNLTKSVTKMGFKINKGGLKATLSGLNRIPFMSLTKGMFGIYGKMAKTGLKGIDFGYNALKTTATSLLNEAKDVYSKHKMRIGFPLITKSQIENGELIRADGKIVRSIKDITMPIMTMSTGETLITMDDIRDGLVDIRGNTLYKKAAKVAKVLMGIPKRLFNIGTKGISLGIQGVSKFVNMIFGKKDKKGGGFFTRIKESFSKGFESTSSKIIKRLDKIIEIISPKKKREGSYEDYVSDISEIEATNDKVTKKKKSFFSSLKNKFKKPRIKKPSIKGGLLSKFKNLSTVAKVALGSTIPALASGAIAGASSLAGMATTAGAFLLTNPVGWAILGTAAVGAAGYGLYKLFSDSDQEESALTTRMSIYGVSKSLQDEIEDLENETLNNLEDKTPMDNSDIENWAEKFGFDSNDKKQVSFWLTWYKRRFVPSFILYKELIKINTGKDLNDISDIELKKIEEINTLYKKAAKVKIAAYIDYVPTLDAFMRISSRKEKTTTRKVKTKTYKHMAAPMPHITKSYSDVHKYLSNRSTQTPMVLTTGSELGALSAKYESSKFGSYAIGFDSIGGTSYGKYQIATRTGTFNRFLSWCDANGANDVANRLREAGDPDGGPNGPVAATWKRLAKEGKIQTLEKAFIKETHYQAALDLMSPELRNLIQSSPALQQVLWSTSVQHGPSGAASIFNKTYAPNIPVGKFISNIYANRSTKFGSSNARVRSSVMKRFREEKNIVLAMAKSSPQYESVDSPIKQASYGQSNSPIKQASYTSVPTTTRNVSPAKQNANNVTPDFMPKDTISRATSPEIRFSDLLNVNREQLGVLVDIRSGILLLSKLAAKNNNVSKEELSGLVDDMNKQLDTLTEKRKSIPKIIDMNNLIDVSKKEIRI